jgi:hypothetical protein
MERIVKTLGKLFLSGHITLKQMGEMLLILDIHLTQYSHSREDGKSKVTVRQGMVMEEITL